MVRKRSLRKSPYLYLFSEVLCPISNYRRKESWVIEFFTTKDPLLSNKELSVTTSAVCKSLRIYYYHQEPRLTFPKSSNWDLKKKKKNLTHTHMCGRESTFKGTLLSGNFKDLLTLATVTENYICFCLRKGFNNILFLEYYINSWHAAFRCLKGAIFLFWDIRAQEGDYRLHGSLWNLPKLGHFLLLLYQYLQRFKCPQALTEAQVDFHSQSDPAQHHWRSTSRVEASTLRRFRGWESKQRNPAGF